MTVSEYCSMFEDQLYNIYNELFFKNNNMKYRG